MISFRGKMVTNGRTRERQKEWKTLDKRSVQLIPANGKQSDNKGQTSSATVMSKRVSLVSTYLPVLNPGRWKQKNNWPMIPAAMDFVIYHSLKYQ